MQKFLLVTRGRTGSTAVLDELARTPGVSATQELFLRYDFDNDPDFVKQNYNLLMPFDLWRKEKWRRFLFHYYSESRQACRYLRVAEKIAEDNGLAAFGWKLLSHHFDERPYIEGLLRYYKYSVIYLKRSIVHQVLSGMVAKQRGVYNSLKKISDNGRYLINPEEFRWHVQWERDCVNKDIARLKSAGFKFIEVDYELFCSDRKDFYDRIFDFLGLPQMIPPTSDFVKVIGDLELTIGNFDDIRDIATEMGEVL